MHEPIFLRSRVTTIAFSIFLAAMHHNAAAFGSINEISQDPIAAEFKGLDRNQDGRLTHAEAGRDSEIAPRFNKADRNHDGKLSEAEYADTKNELQQARMKSFIEDSALTAKIKAELLKDNVIRGLAISVETYRGKVILSGFVDNEHQVRRAAEIASGVRGVLGVKNSLLLKG